MSRPATGHVSRLQQHQPALWLAAVLLYGIGDLVTTTVGLQISGINEIGPVAGPVIEQYGTAGMVTLKAATVGASYLCWRVIPQPHRAGIPLGLVVVGVAVTAWNTVMVSVAL